MTQTTKYPDTVRELGEMASALGILPSELLELLGPVPMPPAGYTLTPKSDDRWVGAETIKSGWIITPTWYASTNTHYIEVWLAEHYRPNYSPLSASEALALAADLAAVSRAATGGQN